MVQMREFTYPSSDGLHTVYAREWAPDCPPRAVVQIAHGVSDHIGWYAPVGEYLAERGILVCGNDHLGHGRTAEGKFGSFAPRGGWDMAVEDLREKGISPVYLVTDHTGFYERYGWEFLCMVQGDGEPEMSRMYIHR